MRSPNRLAGKVLVAIAVAALGLGTVIYVSNARQLGRQYPVAKFALSADAAPDAAQRGKALAAMKMRVLRPATMAIFSNLFCVGALPQ